jgi:aminopeptidase N
VWPGKAYQRVKDAGNMTDRLARWPLLVQPTPTWPSRALERFHALFRTSRWHRQVVCPAGHGARAGDGNVLPRQAQLMQHPDFSLKNPNRARSWCSATAMATRRPSTAPTPPATSLGRPRAGARRAQPAAGRPPGARHGPLARLAEPYRSAAREAIARVAAQAELSNDVREIVTRAGRRGLLRPQ